MPRREAIRVLQYRGVCNHTHESVMYRDYLPHALRGRGKIGVLPVFKVRQRRAFAVSQT